MRKFTLIAAALLMSTACSSSKQQADHAEAPPAEEYQIRSESEPYPGAGAAPTADDAIGELAEAEEAMAEEPMAATDDQKPMPSRPMAMAEKRRAKVAERGPMPATPPPAKPAVVEPEPADPAPRPDMSEDHGVNPMTDTSEDRFSTFSIDVDTGSYTLARRLLRDGRLPPAASVRLEEFINYFGYDYQTPDSGDFAVHFEAAPSPFTGDGSRYLMRIGVKGRVVPAHERKPVHLTFLVDVSGSMSSPDKLGLARQALTVLTNNLEKGDTVAIATYAGRVAKILDPTGVDKKHKILSALDSLSSGGSTAMNDGLGLAYRLALSNFEAGHVNRVIVLSDGDANVGPSSHQDILKQIKKYVDEGVTLSTIGFGMGNYRDTLMEQLANQGNGNYHYIDSIEEARKVFGEQIDGTLEVIAKDVKIQVEFDPKAVSHYRLLGYENRDIADRDFRNDRVDAGEIGSGHSVTALYEVVLKENAPAQDLAVVRMRHKQPQGAKAAESTFSFSRAHLRSNLREASKDFQFASAVATFAEILRASPYVEGLTLDLVEEVARGAAKKSQKDRQEFLELVKRAKALKARASR